MKNYTGDVPDEGVHKNGVRTTTTMMMMSNNNRGPKRTSLLVLVVTVVTSVFAFVPPATQHLSPYTYTKTTVATATKTKSSTTTRLWGDIMRPSGRIDIDVVFGSEANHRHTNNNDNNNNSSSSTSSTIDHGLSDLDLDDDEDQKDRLRRKQVVSDLLQQQEHEYNKKERRQKQWGKFANVTSKQELEPLLEEERNKLQKENQLKAQAAQASGIFMEVLEPMEQIYPEALYKEGGIEIKIGSQQTTNDNRWYAQVDEELEQEWNQLMGDAKDEDDDDDSSSNSDEDDGSTNNNNSNNNPVGDNVNVQLDDKGKIITRDKLQGVRVGSAGGWSLEVFPGDFVVHKKYGIGRFEKTCLRPKSKLTPEEKEAQQKRRGELLTQWLYEAKGSVGPNTIQELRSRFGTENDTDPISNPQTTVLEITYSDAVVHVPVDRAYRLSRYRAGDANIKPKLTRVKGETWIKAKQRVEENTLQLAQDVLALYATRETLQRQPLDPALEEKVKEFEQSFPYEPTPDQITCFDDVENDMVWRSRPMDRLICGDVGFGKTEVALRALFRSVANGNQAAILAPTGVLAAQHYKTIVKRMGPDTPWNVTVALLRGGMGRKTKAGKIVREQIESGEIQLTVGTHALLSNDLTFKNLGLLVVDEEQRFGVKQKERLKLICGGVDVLTLSATPIPRTLQMSLSGIRDTTTIRSPPPMRKPTQTVVEIFSEDLVKEAIGRELERGGQCYYVVPRISMLQEAEDTIQELFPDIRIIQAHGQMKKNGAEANVAKFAEGHYDVLLATTVIENGVDIPTVNTIIVQNSQNFGMSTLYQLRGRVGRSDRQAFAYFLHHIYLTNEAAKRLEAIWQLHELGSGFDVANRDLEIRGAGSLLGTEQSGMAAKVGFDLYMRMLKKSIRKLRGLDVPFIPRTNFLMLPKGTSVEVFSIPEDYIVDNKERDRQETKARLAESTAGLIELTNKWKENYGDIPSDVQFQLKTMHLHACTRRLGVDVVGIVQNEESGKFDCVLRSPGLRPRHWAQICSLLPKGVAPTGLNICFPARFTATGEDEESSGGKKIDLKALLTDESLSGDNDGDDWDAVDEEEVEAMKQISSALNIKSMDDVDFEQYPHFVVRNFGKADSKAIDKLLKLLLPVAKVIYEQQEEDKEKAMLAADLREKQSLIKEQNKKDAVLERKSLTGNFSPIKK